MIAVLRERNFLLLWLGGLVSQAGDWTLAIALPVYVFDLTGSALATGGIFLAQSLPRLPLGLVAGVLADRWDRRRIMIVADLGRFAVLPLLLLVQTADQLPILYSVVAAEAILGLFFVPAHAALVPHIVGDQELVAANSLRSLGWEMMRLVAPPVGGLLMATHGLSAVVLLDSSSFLLSAALLVTITVPNFNAEARVNVSMSGSGLWAGMRRDISIGLRAVASDRLLRVLFLFGGLYFVAEGIINVLGFPWLAQELEGGAAERGWLAAAQAVGGIMGGSFAYKLMGRTAPGRVLGISAMLFGVLSILLANVAMLPIAEPYRWPLALLLKGLSGIPLVVVIIVLDTLLVRCSEDRFRGRVVAAYGVLTGLALVSGQALASVFGDPLGVVPVLSLQGILYAIAGLVALVFIPQGLFALGNDTLPRITTSQAREGRQ
jgi:MFS family permease